MNDCIAVSNCLYRLTLSYQVPCSVDHVLCVLLNLSATCCLSYLCTSMKCTQCVHSASIMTVLYEQITCTLQAVTLY